MEIYLLEYCEEIKHGEITIERYNLIGLYFSESEAQQAKKVIILERKIEEGHLFISATKMGKLQWEGGFISV